jgi:hypothetical protein
MSAVGTYMASKKRSAVILRTIYPSELNSKLVKVRDITAVVKDFAVVPANIFANYIEGYLSRFGITKAITAELLADPTKRHEFTKGMTTYSLRIANDGCYKVLVSQKVSGLIYGFTYLNEQMICKFESMNAPSQIFNTEKGTLQVVFNNHIEELKARFSH